MNDLKEELDEVLKSLPLTRKVRRDIKKTFLKKLGKQPAIFLLSELRRAAASLSYVLKVISLNK